LLLLCFSYFLVKSGRQNLTGGEESVVSRRSGGVGDRLDGYLIGRTPAIDSSSLHYRFGSTQHIVQHVSATRLWDNRFDIPHGIGVWDDVIVVALRIVSINRTEGDVAIGGRVTNLDNITGRDGFEDTGKGGAGGDDMREVSQDCSLDGMRGSEGVGPV